MAAAKGAAERVRFEVSGKVQGVFFRKYTQKKAVAEGLVGWCANTDAGTVQGVVEGPAAAVEKFKHWVSTVGSPASRIDKADFAEDDSGEQYKKFEIRDDKPQ